MRCNWRRWLWGIIPLLVLSWVAVQAEHGRLERDLAERARLALVEGGFTWAQAEFKARDALLMGRAPQEGEPGKAADALAAVWGVRVVDNKADLLDKAEKYVWIASRRNNRIRLSGYAPSIDTRRAILGVTKASFPGFEIVDRTTLARGSPSSDVWLAGVSFALKQLTAIKRGDVRLEDLGLTVTGQAEDVTAYRTIKQALANSVPKGINVTADRVTAPVASPYMWAAHSADGRLVLSGHVPNDAVRADLVAAAKAGPAPCRDRRSDAAGRRRTAGLGRHGGRNSARAGAARGWRRGYEGCHPGRLRHGRRCGDGRGDSRNAARGRAGDDQAHRPDPGEGAAAARAADPSVAPPPSVVPPERDRNACQGTRGGKSRPHRHRSAIHPARHPWCRLERAETPAKGPEAASPARTDTAAQSAPPAPPPVEGSGRGAGESLRGAAGKRRQPQGRSSSASPAPSSKAPVSRRSTSSPRPPSLARACASRSAATPAPRAAPQLNQRLSLRRAQSVVAYLVHAGVDVAQLEPIGHGAAQPVAPNDGSQNMARNRRIEFTVRPK